MPFKSKQQMKACFATKGFHGKIDCHEWAKETGDTKSLPNKVKSKNMKSKYRPKKKYQQGGYTEAEYQDLLAAAAERPSSELPVELAARTSGIPDGYIPPVAPTVSGVEAPAKKPTAGSYKYTGSFGKAFRSARSSGVKTFEWNGRKYTTELASDGSRAKATVVAPGRPKTSSATRPEERRSTREVSETAEAKAAKQRAETDAYFKSVYPDWGTQKAEIDPETGYAIGTQYFTKDGRVKTAGEKELGWLEKQTMMDNAGKTVLQTEKSDNQFLRMLDWGLTGFERSGASVARTFSGNAQGPEDYVNTALSLLPMASKYFAPRYYKLPSGTGLERVTRSFRGTGPKLLTNGAPVIEEANAVRQLPAAASAPKQLPAPQKLIGYGTKKALKPIPKKLQGIYKKLKKFESQEGEFYQQGGTHGLDLNQEGTIPFQGNPQPAVAGLWDQPTNIDGSSTAPIRPGVSVPIRNYMPETKNSPGLALAYATALGSGLSEMAVHGQQQRYLQQQYAQLQQPNAEPVENFQPFQQYNPYQQAGGTVIPKLKPKYNFSSLTKPTKTDSLVYENDFNGILNMDQDHIRSLSKLRQYGVPPTLTDGAYELGLNKQAAYEDAIQQALKLIQKSPQGKLVGKALGLYKKGGKYRGK